MFHLPVNSVYASKIVLSWLVGNPDLRYHPSYNPADCASRGSFPSKLLLDHELWVDLRLSDTVVSEKVMTYQVVRHGKNIPVVVLSWEVKLCGAQNGRIGDRIGDSISTIRYPFPALGRMLCTF